MVAEDGAAIAERIKDHAGNDVTVRLDLRRDGEGVAGSDHFVRIDTYGQIGDGMVTMPA